jgi:hypothetical protein
LGSWKLAAKGYWFSRTPTAIPISHRSVPISPTPKALIFWRVKTQVYIEIWCANGEMSSMVKYPTYDDAPGVIRSLPTATVIIMIIRYYIDANCVAIPRGKQMRAHEIKGTFIQIGAETLSPLSLCGGLETLNPDSFCRWKKRKAWLPARSWNILPTKHFLKLPGEYQRMIRICATPTTLSSQVTARAWPAPSFKIG